MMTLSNRLKGIILAVGGSAFWAYVSSTKYILPQEASILNAMEPLASIVFSVLLLDVLFQLPEIAGTILIILPILYITTRKNK